MKRTLMILLLGSLMSFSMPAWSYDTEMAQSYAALFSQVNGAKAGKMLHFMKPEGFIKAVHSGKTIVPIDVRTPAETVLFSLTTPETLRIPVHMLFQKENLDRIPVDKKVVIICKSGARATAVGTALRHTGFKNVYILKGGFQALAKLYGPKQAYPKPAKK